jgi:hypothetical protein
MILFFTLLQLLVLKKKNGNMLGTRVNKLINANLVPREAVKTGARV